MLFRLALLRAAAQRNDLSPDDRRALRQVILWPRRRIDGEVVRLDDLVEEQAIATLQATTPEVLAAATSTSFDPLTAASELVGQVNWQALLDWLVANLPKIIEIILSLIALF